MNSQSLCGRSNKHQITTLACVSSDSQTTRFGAQLMNGRRLIRARNMIWIHAGGSGGGAAAAGITKKFCHSRMLDLLIDAC